MSELGTDDGARSRIARFSPEIQLGHIVQAVLMLFAGIGIYFTVVTRISEHDGKFLVHDQRLATLDGSVGRLEQEGGKMAGQAQRLATNEAAIVRLELGQQNLATQIGGKLDSIISQIADLRVQAARGGQHDPARR